MDYSIAFAETIEILNNIEEKYTLKIPKELYDLINSQKAEMIDFKYDKNLELVNQKIHQETIELLSYLSYNFWTNDKGKKKLEKAFKDNFVEIEKTKMEKYNPDDLFKNSKKKEVDTEDLPIEMNSKESIIQNLFAKLKDFIRKVFKNDR